MARGLSAYFRPRRWVWSLVLLACCPLPGAAQSDADTIAAVRACAEIQSNRARLACFDELAAGTSAVEPVAAAPSVAASRGSTPATVAAAATSARPATEQATVARRDERAATERGEANRAAAQSATADETIRIVDVRPLDPSRARLYAEDGRVFLQMTGGGRGLPPVPFDVAVRSGVFGGIVLVPEGRRMIRVTLLD